MVGDSLLTRAVRAEGAGISRELGRSIFIGAVFFFRLFLLFFFSIPTPFHFVYFFPFTSIYFIFIISWVLDLQRMGARVNNRRFGQSHCIIIIVGSTTQ